MPACTSRQPATPLWWHPALIAEKSHVDEISGVLREVLSTY